MSYWQDKTALVTGGSGGLGFCIARQLAQCGANVVIAGRNEENLKRAEAELRSADFAADAIVADVTQDEDVAMLFEQLTEKYDGLDVLVNNVGRSTRSDVLDTTPDDFRKLMEINFYTVVRCTRAAMPLLVRSKGHVVNIGSLSAKTPSPFLSAYAASKFAVAAYSQQLRLEGPKEVHSLLVCPGPISRDDAGGRYDEQAESLPDRARKPGGGARLKRVSPVDLAKRILRACERRQPELVVPAKARVLFIVSQVWPKLGDWMLRKWT